MKLYHTPFAFHSVYANGYGLPVVGSLKLSLFSLSISQFIESSILWYHSLFSTQFIFRIVFSGLVII
ncbi:MAG: hypothetical protein LBC61_00135 [Candidatus Peribacteria bacterium]|nr:hypothetical protein [Candidatus Peribacteria bacterium]